MLRTFVRRQPDERGQGLMEYAMVLGLCSILAVASLTTLGQTIADTLIGPVAGAFP